MKRKIEIQDISLLLKGRYGMSYCLNFGCQNPHNLDRTGICHACGTDLLLNSRYLALQVIRQNRFSRTFLAIDRSKPNRSPSIIKQIFSQKEPALFQQEAMKLKELRQHDQIPTLLDALEHKDYQYLIQEFIDGKNLAEELKSGYFSEIKVHSLLLDLLPMLQFVHQHQVVYRGIKPKNIIRRASDRKLCLVDFETAKLSADKAFLETEAMIGSSAYAIAQGVLTIDR